MLKQHLPCSLAALSHAQHHSFISDPSTPAPIVAGAGGLRSVHGDFYLLLLPPHTSLLQHGPSTSCRAYVSAMEHLLLLWPWSLPCCFSLSLFPPPLSIWHFVLFECFRGGAISLADVLSCVLWWVHWSWLDLAVSGMRQPLVSSHRGHSCSPPGLPPSCHLHPKHTWEKVMKKYWKCLASA